LCLSLYLVLSSSLLFFSHCSPIHLYLHSFPTRRSSDLIFSGVSAENVTVDGIVSLSTNFHLSGTLAFVSTVSPVLPLTLTVSIALPSLSTKTICVLCSFAV